MSEELRRLASEQDGVVARWQLCTAADPWGNAVDWAARDLRRIFPGVYVTGWGPISQKQTWRGATLTAPGTSLSVASAAGLAGIRPDPGRVVTVVRHGQRGVHHQAGLRVSYSRTLEGNITDVDGISTTTPERTIIDLWPHLTARARSKMLREAFRIEATTATTLLAAVHAHRRRAGTAALRREVLQRLRLPFERCRSDAEAFGLVILDTAGVPIPDVNTKIAGLEADYCWPDLREIIEIDGPQWHRFKDEDARKTAIWTAAGFRVQRITSGLLFSDPEELLRIAPSPPGAAASVLP